MDPKFLNQSDMGFNQPDPKEVEMVKILESVKRIPVRTLLIVVVVILCAGVFVLLGSNAVALAKQAAAPAAAPVLEKAPVVAPVVKAPAASVSAPVVAAPVVAAKEPQQSRSAEVVTTIRQVGGAEEIVRDWHNKNADQVTFPYVEDLGWEDILRIDGKPAILVAWCANKGTSSVAGEVYLFDKGYCGATITTEPSIILVTSWNDSAKDVKEQHRDMWAEAYVINENMDPEETLGRLLSEWLVVQSKDLGFKVGLTGELSKMKYSEAQEAVKSNEPLFPDQLQQLPAGEKKPIIMTVQRVGSDGTVIADLKNRDAEYVTMPVKVEAEYEGILKVDGKMQLIVCMSSDPGTFKFQDVSKEIDTEFVACVITHEWLSIVVGTGYNEDNGRRNISGDVYIVPADEDIDAVAKSYATILNVKENKPYVFVILSDGSLFEIK